jgi:dihydroneopterin aldolase
MALLDTMPYVHSTPGQGTNISAIVRSGTEIAAGTPMNIFEMGSMDIVYLHGIRLETVIGIWDWERQIKQTVVVDLDMGSDISRAAESDALKDTIDYKAVAKRLMNLADDSDFFLVEALAEEIANILISDFGIPWVRIRINKQGALRGVRDVGVVIERGSKP